MDWNYALHVKHEYILVFCHILVQIILSFLQYAPNPILKRFCYTAAFLPSTLSADLVLAPQTIEEQFGKIIVNTE